MSHTNTVFNQVLHLMPRHQFDTLVERYGGDRYSKHFTCWNQLMVLLFAQIRGLDSLRDIVTGLRMQAPKWYHIGLSGVAKSTLSDANNGRDWRIFEGLFYHMLSRCRELAPAHGFKFKNPLYTIDSTTIDLCLSVFPWAKFRKTKGALKIHCLLDHRGCIPSFVLVTEGRRHDLRVVKETDFPLIPDSIVSIDRAYIDFKYLYSLHSKGVFFVTRVKRNLAFEIAGQQEMPDKKGLLADKTVSLSGFNSKKDYPAPLRIVAWQDADTGKPLFFLTNNFSLAASTIAAIYKARWQIELFFKWIKQNLKIKSFLGTSHNAVMTQIWVAMIYFLLLAYVQFQTRYRHGMLALSRIFRETLMERVSMIDLLSINPEHGLKKNREPAWQMTLF